VSFFRNGLNSLLALPWFFVGVRTAELYEIEETGDPDRLECVPLRD
jgi:hypothetical protein